MKDPVTTQSVEKPPRAIQETPTMGLSADDVAVRVFVADVDLTSFHTSRSFAEILRANLFTRFNLILGTLLVVILIVGQLQDALFGIVLVCNALIGIAQESHRNRVPHCDLASLSPYCSRPGSRGVSIGVAAACKVRSIDPERFQLVWAGIVALRQ